MPRRARAPQRPVNPDAQHRSRLVQQVINKVMLHGKKATAEEIVYDALSIVGERTGRPPVEVLDEAITELTPNLEVKSRRVGGATYQVPIEVPARRARTLAVRWLVNFARNRNEKSMAERLAREIMDATHSRAAPGSGRTTSSVWPRRTRLSLTTAGSSGAAPGSAWAVLAWLLGISPSSCEATTGAMQRPPCGACAHRGRLGAAALHRKR